MESIKGLDELKAMCADDRCRRFVLEACPGIDAAASLTRFNTRIHPRDQMLLHSLQHHRDAGAAFSQYFAVARQQYASAMQIVRSVFGIDAGRVDLLDFACGYGRLLRYLTLALPPAQLWASELQSDAVAYVADAFGVQTITSHAEPELFQPGRSFDVIWVASLFSHLPERLFHAWLERLHALLTPRGVLCFSVRDAALLPSGDTLPPSGIVYLQHSENADLATDIYGTTYASEDFVRRAATRFAGTAPALYRLPRALANEQDIYVLAKDSQRNLSALHGFRRGPWGWLDQRMLCADGTLQLQGWAASLDDGEIDHVSVEVAGQSFRCTGGIARPDVAAAFGDARLGHAGWRFEHAFAVGTHATEIAVTVHSRRGEVSPLYIGSVRASGPGDAAESGV
ncbi:MAG: class I SAM-dependent methyltransferase [Dokdonella sp.]